MSFNQIKNLYMLKETGIILLITYLVELKKLNIKYIHTQSMNLQTILF